MDTSLVWAEVDLGAIAHNIRELRRITDPKARLMAVVKADGYGHGAVPCARVALQNGADMLAVARLPEALALRQAGFEVPILIFGYTPPVLAHQLTAHSLTQTVWSVPTAAALSAAASAAGKRIKVHLKVDTGMGRLGLLPDAMRPSAAGLPPSTDALEEIRTMVALPGLELEGVYTHFAAADSADKAFANLQLERFMTFLDQLRQAGISFPVRHAANSAAIIDLPAAHLDLVRPGIAVYGLYPSDEIDRDRIALQPAMAIKARVVHLKSVPAGFTVSYGMTHTTPRPTVIASVPVGYADGFNRLLSSRGQMLVKGVRAPIVGRVCMDQTLIDVGHISGVDLEDEVVIMGAQGPAAITADDLAAELKTINYEIVSALTARIPRVYRP